MWDRKVGVVESKTAWTNTGIEILRFPKKINPGTDSMTNRELCKLVTTGRYYKSISDETALLISKVCSFLTTYEETCAKQKELLQIVNYSRTIVAL